jgi:Mg2+ and Co2+ transporter CorA
MADHTTAVVEQIAWQQAGVRMPRMQKRAHGAIDEAPDLATADVVRAGVRHGERDAPIIDGGGVSTFLYDADGDDRDVRLDKALIDGLADDDLLWVDVDSSQEGAVARVTALIPVHIDSMSVTDVNRPFIHSFGESFVLGVLPVPSKMAQPKSEMLICAVGRNWLVTVHDGEAGALKGFADHLRGDSVLGRLDAPSFLARLLEWVVNAYLDYLDQVHDAIDELEGAILRDRAGDDVVGKLIELRHDVGRLRRRLSPHRQVFQSLSHPSFDVISGSSAAREFEMLADRLEMAVQAVHTTREMIVGSFDVVTSQTVQRTSHTMRVLATVSLTVLPIAAIASVLGMPMVPKYLVHEWVFWAALAAMVIISTVVLVTMRFLRHWL